MNTTTEPLSAQLQTLQLAFIREHYAALAQQAAAEQWPPIDDLARLVEGELQRRQDRALARRLKAARWPLLKTLEQFQWNWPKKINRLQVQQVFRLQFLESHTNVIFLGGVGLGKTHRAIALAYTACLAGSTVLLTTAVDAVNTLIAAQAAGRLKTELNRYLKPHLLCLDEVGYLPIDKTGADLLFQIISHRYEQGSMIITSNRPYKKWAEIFNNDSTLTSALLDRLLHHAETVLIEGSSYRMKDRLELASA
jgi:DNA replication protein DnaC